MKMVVAIPNIHHLPDLLSLHSCGVQFALFSCLRIRWIRFFTTTLFVAPQFLPSFTCNIEPIAPHQVSQFLCQIPCYAFLAQRYAVLPSAMSRPPKFPGSHTAVLLSRASCAQPSVCRTNWFKWENRGKMEVTTLW